MIETNFKHTDIGVIPHDWEVKNINYLFNFKQGVQCPIHLQSLQNTAGKIRFIRIIDLTQPNEPPRYILDPGAAHHITEQDLFMVRYGSPGLIGYGYTGVVANNLFQLIPRITISTHFYKYILTECHKEILALCSSSTMPAVNFTALSSLQIPLPPTLAEQEKIANALSKIDQLINDLEALIEKKKVIKQGTMQDLLTAKRRLKGFTGEWTSKQIIEIVGKIKRGQSLQSKDYKKGDIPVVAGGKQYAGFHNVANHHGRTITISGSGANAGYVSFHANPIFATDCSVIDDKGNFDLLFIYYVLQQRQNDIYKLQSGGAQPHIYPKNIEDIVSIFPPTLAEQNAIANILSSMDTEITNLEQKRNKYIVIKQGMMQNLLTGKIRLI